MAEEVGAGTLIVVVGMPGSGKSEYIKQLSHAGQADAVFDDYQAGAVEDNADPRRSKFYGKLLAAVRAGKTVAVSDVRYCVRKELHRFLAAVLTEIPETGLDIRYFDNNPGQCRENVKNRPRMQESIVRELELIDEYTPQYVVPTQVVLEVYRPSSQHENTKKT